MLITHTPHPTPLQVVYSGPVASAGSHFEALGHSPPHPSVALADHLLDTVIRSSRSQVSDLLDLLPVTILDIHLSFDLWFEDHFEDEVWPSFSGCLQVAELVDAFASSRCGF